ncbi:MAG: hypothetical protein DRH26_01125 [Deltaproteobacteria bacterium]|nr:MAG: hypothetical protein DRH26_01125 [Deltaproteobacteria bacterium]
MQITLNQKEIEKAIITYVGQQGISIAGKKVDVTLIAGRGTNGMSASLDILDVETAIGDTVVEINEVAQCDPVAAPEEEVVEATDNEDVEQAPLFGS